MSRTRKDRPYRVKVNDPREPKRVSHRHSAFGISGTNFLGQDFAVQGHCTADQPAVHRSNRDRLAVRPCETDLDWRLSHSRRVPRGVITEAYWNPFRQEERITLQKLAAEYNAQGDLETEAILSEQHRHAGFGGGWWD
jgi:hypothetical protein